MMTVYILISLRADQAMFNLKFYSRTEKAEIFV